MNENNTVENSTEKPQIKMDDNGFIEIVGKGQLGSTIRVRIPASDIEAPATVVSLFYDTYREMSTGIKVSRVREHCYIKNRTYFYPDLKRAKMERMMITVVANHPHGIRMDLLLDELNLDRKTASAYIGSANNWTSEFLRVEGEYVKSSLKGIEDIFQKINTITSS